MPYRTIIISWLPRTSAEWATFTAARQEAARLWSDLVEVHHEARTANSKWPTDGELKKWSKKKYCDLHSQSVQQTIGQFCEAVESARQLRSKGHDAMYPWRKTKYRDVTYTNQAARIRDGVLVLPNGKSGWLCVPVPSTVTLPGRIMEVVLRYGEVLIVCKAEDEERECKRTIGVDLGVNSLLAATDGKESIVVSGRRAKSLVRLRNKRLGSISSAQSKRTNGSRRHKRLQRAKYKVLNKCRRSIRDLCHKATRKVADAFPDAKAYVGKPFNDAAAKIGRRQAQQVSQACGRKIIQQLDYKLEGGAIQVDEHYTSQTCPVCGERRKCGRVYRCKCGAVAPRDVVGCLNIRSIGMKGCMKSGRRLPKSIKFCYPEHVSRSHPGSPKGTGQVARKRKRDRESL